MTAEKLAVQAALNSKIRRLEAWKPGNQYVDVAEIASPCPQCGGPVVSAFVYDDCSSPEYYYSHSAHVCLNLECDYREERMDSVGTDHVFAPELYCAFCGRKEKGTF